MIRSLLMMSGILSCVWDSGGVLASDKHALLIGVTKYARSEMSTREHSEDGAKALAEMLRSGGYEVEHLLVSQARVTLTTRDERVKEHVPLLAQAVFPSETQDPKSFTTETVDLPLVAQPEAEKLLTNTLGMKLALIPKGEFQMGSTDADIEAIRTMLQSYRVTQFMDELPQHEVRITQPFYLGVHEVTKGQFAAFVKAQGYQSGAESDGYGGFGFDGEKFELRPEYTWRNPGFPQTDDHPVLNVDWNDAVAFCEWLSLKEGKTYQLPTEAQWEYACRAGTTTPCHFGAVNNGEKANVNGIYPLGTETKGPSIRGTMAVGSYAGNAFGLYDMHGNAYEWCQDRAGSKAYAERTGVTIDPLITGTTGRIQRGGSWNEGGHICRSANRIWNIPRYRSSCLGFRVLRTQAESSPPGQGF